MKRNRAGAAAGTASCGDCKENPIMIMESPLIKLTPPKLLTPVTALAGATRRPVRPVSLAKEHTKRRLNCDFQLYSHATDPLRCVESVLALDGAQTTSSQEVEGTPHTSSTIPSPLPDTSQIERKPFNKFSQSSLETLADAGLTDCMDRTVCFVQQLEQLLAHGYYVPMNRIPVIIDTVLRMSDKHILYRFHSLLCQDVRLRNQDQPQTSTHSYLQDSLRTVCTTLLLTPNHLPSRIILHYMFHLDPVLSSTLTHGLLDVAFSALTVDLSDTLPSLTDTILVWLTRGNTECLIEELSARIDRLSSTVDKCSVLDCIPRLDVRLTLIQVILSLTFQGERRTLPPTASLGELCTIHFTRRPYRYNGVPHNLSYFLTLLLLLLETWLLIHGPQRASLQCVGPAVELMMSTLLQDPLLTNELCSPQVWLQLQLLKSFGH